MDFSAPHLGFVYASYAISAVLLAGLTIHVVGRDRKLRGEAKRLETAAERRPS